MKRTIIRRTTETVMVAGILGACFLGVDPALADVVGESATMAISTVAPSLAATLADRGWHHCRTRFLSDHLPHNDDLQMAMQRAIARTADEMRDGWWKTSYGKHHHRDRAMRDTVNGAFDCLAEDAKETLTEASLIPWYAGSHRRRQLDPDGAPKALATYLDALLYGHDEQLQRYVRENLGSWTARAFAEELQADTPVGNRAWRAYQMMVFNALGLGHADLRRGQDATRAQMTAIKTALDEITDRLGKSDEEQRVSIGEAGLSQVIAEQCDRVIAAVEAQFQLSRDAARGWYEATVKTVVVESARTREHTSAEHAATRGAFDRGIERVLSRVEQVQLTLETATSVAAVATQDESRNDFGFPRTINIALNQKTLVDYLLGPDPIVGNVAMHEFTASPDRAIDELIPLFGTQAIQNQARVRVTKLFDLIGEPAVLPLLEVIRDGPWHAKRDAAASLSASHRPSASDVLGSLLDYPDPDVVRLAIESLGRIGANGWTPAIRDLTLEYGWIDKLGYFTLCAFLRFLGHPSIQNEFISDIASLENFVDQMELRAKAGTPSIQALAQHALKNIRWELSVNVIDKIVPHWVHHENPVYRELCMTLLGHFHLSRTVGIAAHALEHDQDAGVRFRAAWALSQYRCPEAFDRTLEIHQRLGDQTKQIANLLVSGSLHSSIDLTLAELAFRASNHSDARHHIEDILARYGDIHRASALYSLGLIGNASDVKTVQDDLQSDRWIERAYAAVALTHLAGSSADSKLRTALRESSHEFEHAMLLAALGTIGDEYAKELYGRLGRLELASGSSGDASPLREIKFSAKREFVLALSRVPTIGGDSPASAWAELMGENVDEVLEDFTQ